MRTLKKIHKSNGTVKIFLPIASISTKVSKWRISDKAPTHSEE